MPDLVLLIQEYQYPSKKIPRPINRMSLNIAIHTDPLICVAL